MKKSPGKKSVAKKPSRLSKWLLPVLPALITGLVSIFTTLLITGRLFPRATQGTSAPGVTESRAPVLDAPDIRFSSKRINDSLTDCMSHATSALEKARLTGRDAKAYYAWGYQNQTSGIIWCNTDDGLVIYLAAGRSAEETSNVLEALRKSY